MSLRIDLGTLLGCSPLLGHVLADKSALGAAQDPALQIELQRDSSLELDEPAWAFGALDLMVSGAGDDLCFYPAELNGTGMGGLLRLPTAEVQHILDNCARFGASLTEDAPLVLMAYGGARPPAQVHDRMVIADAIAAGLRARGTTVKVRANLDGSPFDDGPVVGIVPFEQASTHIRVDDGVASWSGRRISAIFHDRLADATARRGARDCLMMNRCHAVCTDKGLFYERVNELLRQHAFPHMPSLIEVERVLDLASLRRAVIAHTASGAGAVVKPHGGSQGKGISFFPPFANDSTLESGFTTLCTNPAGFPFTVSRLIEGRTLSDGPLAGHRFDLRIVVYADGRTLRAFPTNARIAKARFSPGTTDPRALITNVSAFQDGSVDELDVPLTRKDTLERLGIELSHLTAACQFATAIVRYCAVAPSTVAP